MNGLALCAGAGGLELGLRLALGDGYRTVGYCEREARAAANLVARMGDASLDQAAIWDDLESFPSELYSGRVDIVSAGIPCQPWSVAGKQQGKADERWIWEDAWRIIRETGCGIAFLENVAGFVTGGGLDAVLGDLAESGWDAEWITLRASGVGASQERNRWFMLAYRVRIPGGERAERERVRELCSQLARSQGGGFGERGRAQGIEGFITGGGAGMGGAAISRRAGAEIAGTDREDEGDDRGGRKDSQRTGIHVAGTHAGTSGQGRQPGSGGVLGDTASDHWRAGNGRTEAGAWPDGERRRGSSSAGAHMASAVGGQLSQPGRGSQGRAGTRPAGPLFPPGPSDDEAWRVLLHGLGRFDLLPAINQSEAEIIARVCGVADGLAGRLDRLRLCGNGVVPLQAAVAFVELVRRAVI